MPEEGARYRAEMENGDVFIARGSMYYIHAAEGAVWELRDDGQPILDGGFPIPFKVRRGVATDHDHLYLVSEWKAASLNAYSVVKEATHVGPGVVLILTHEPVVEVLWGGKVASYIRAEPQPA